MNKLRGGTRFQVIRLFIISNSLDLIPHFVLLLSWPYHIIEKCLCTPDRATDPTLKMRHVSAVEQVCTRRYYSNNLRGIFLGHPVYLLNSGHILAISSQILIVLRGEPCSIWSWNLIQQGVICNVCLHMVLFIYGNVFI